MTDELRSLSLLVHADSKVGKSWLGDTTPGPRLVLDAEGGSRFTPSRKKVWNPLTEAPPAWDGTWDTCIVYVRDYQTILRAYQWLETGQHNFKSVVMDSVSEIQARCKDSISGVDQMNIQKWGDLLTQVSTLVRQFRDLAVHPTNPLQAVVLIAMTKKVDGRWEPYVQGQLAVNLPFYLDVIGYLFVQQLDDGTSMRRLLVSPHPDALAGERVGGRLGLVVDRPNVAEMLNTIYGPEEQPPVQSGEATT